MVWAAGGLAWRRSPAGGVEVLLVHRPKYDDWTIPKGKLVPGESAEDGAVREVGEETGHRVLLGDELASTTYTDGTGRLKTVRYWAMEVVGGAFRPNHEVDEIRWVPLGDAQALLSYTRDLDVLDSFSVQRPDAAPARAPEPPPG